LAGILNGTKGLVVGIANAQSIAYGCAEAFRKEGAALAVTYLNEKTRTFTEPLRDALQAELYLPCDVREPDQEAALFEAIRQKWGRLDFLLHSIAFAPREDLHGRVTD
jgi:enoyl-[acyl-carrier protein] reductase I